MPADMLDGRRAERDAREIVTFLRWLLADLDNGNIRLDTFLWALGSLGARATVLAVRHGGRWAA